MASRRMAITSSLWLALFLLVASSDSAVFFVGGFVPTAFVGRRSVQIIVQAKPNTNTRKNKDSGDDGEVGTGPNWIERSFPVDMGADDGGSNELKKVEDYNLGISGVSFQTGALSKRKCVQSCLGLLNESKCP